MPGILEPPDWTDDKYELEPEYFEKEPSKKPLIVQPEDADRKYTDPLMISRVVHYVKRRSAEHAHELSEIKKLVEEVKSKIIDLEISLNSIAPPERDDKAPEEKPMLLNKITRKEWGAKEVKNVDDMDMMTLPVKKVHLTYNTKTANSDDHAVVTRIVKDIQADHLGRGLPDISYNFLIGGDGNVYEGRGWYLKPEIAASNPEWCDSTIDVAFIGDYHRDDYPYELLDFVQDLMKLGIDNKVVSKDYKILFD